MSLTKKSEGKRKMKKIEDWYVVNKTTPDRWFIRWVGFLVKLMSEVGYQCESSVQIMGYSMAFVKKPRGKDWSKTIKFTHPHLDSVILHLSRKRKQEGGQIHFVYGFGVYEQFIDTISAGYQGDPIMSRLDVGDRILTHIREGWVRSKPVDFGL
jgi:hypothetical protein